MISDKPYKLNEQNYSNRILSAKDN